MAGRLAYRSRNFLIGLNLQRDKVPAFSDYPFNIAAIGNLSELGFAEPVTFFIGENGAGKSTLIEAIAVAYGLNPEGGSRNFRFSTRRSHSGLNDYLRLIRSPRRLRDRYFLRAESYFNVATEIERLDAEPLGDRGSSVPTAASRCTSSHTANRFSRCSSTASGVTVSTFSTSLKPRSHPAVSLRSCRACISWGSRALNS